ncbi:MAG TPA: radical SAM protein [Myxococcota bacterium]|nr:radical SAM protein [Myxococcota bacterium]HRY97100.1 radical SAM protein [Myxococcota bacterium]HSA23155.1 radical SAM protein [Myxococcota bacterium]
MKSFGFQWHLTDRCNLRCAHCYQDDFGPGAERPLEDLFAMVDAVLGALRDRPVSINLTGGEPLLLPGLPALLEHLSSQPNLSEMHVITNATVTAGPVLEALARYERVRYLKVSLEAADEAVNDRVRGPGNLARVRRNLGLYRQVTGKPFVLMMTLGRHNVGGVAAMAALAREVGAAGVIYERFVPLGQSRGFAAEVLGAEGWAHAVAGVLDAAGSEATPDELLAYRAFWLWTDGREDPLEGALCNLGEGSMALMPDGTVYPCRRLPIPVGNVLREPFPRILARLQEFGVPALAPRLTGGLCGLCGVEGCAGCRALARALHGDILADDPQCPLRLAEER